MSTAIVSNNADLTAPRPPGVFTRLKRGVALSSWLGILLGVGLGYIATRPHIYFPLHMEERVLVLFQLAGMLVVGVALALAIRVITRGLHNILRFGASVLGLALAVVSYEIIDSRFYEVFSEFNNPDPNDPGVWISMLLMGCLGAIFGLNLGHGSRPHQQIDIEPLSERTPPPRDERTLRARRGRRKLREREERADARAEALQPVQRAVRRARRAADSTPESEVRRIEVQPRTAPPVAVKPARAMRKKRGVKVRMGRVATSICPYCLEEVKKNDPRGRVVCRICGTPHHGDCWAITGKCEVPHLQT